MCANMCNELRMDMFIGVCADMCMDMFEGVCMGMRKAYIEAHWFDHWPTCLPDSSISPQFSSIRRRLPPVYLILLHAPTFHGIWAGSQSWKPCVRACVRVCVRACVSQMLLYHSLVLLLSQCGASAVPLQSIIVCCYSL